MPVAAGAVLQKLGSNAAYEVEKVGKPHSDGAQGAPSSRCSRRGFDRQASNPLLSRMKSGDSSLGRMEMLGCLARVSSDRPAPHLLEVLLFYVGNSIFVTGKWTRRGSTATWRKVLRLAAAAAVASGSRGEEREHAALARRSAEAAAGSGKATASLPRAAHTGRLCVEEAPLGVEPSQVVVPPPEEKWFCIIDSSPV
ncbi:uncharacterized protein LOC120675172 isoform X2 [Panicum virgatum]|uniref:uncharacterized protein LOC120675172 isoform X2 n=1 Tax=Panicum virgatum TaxID=38727 RepID=UPI0019D648D3|nr:uncharacterized protein LOC120675172 isoform X2 [Panicum virgatum]